MTRGDSSSTCTSILQWVPFRHTESTAENPVGGRAAHFTEGRWEDQVDEGPSLPSSSSLSSGSPLSLSLLAFFLFFFGRRSYSSFELLQRKWAIFQPGPQLSLTEQRQHLGRLVGRSSTSPKQLIMESPCRSVPDDAIKDTNTSAPTQRTRTVGARLIIDALRSIGPPYRRLCKREGSRESGGAPRRRRRRRRRRWWRWWRKRSGDEYERQVNEGNAHLATVDSEPRTDPWAAPGRGEERPGGSGARGEGQREGGEATRRPWYRLAPKPSSGQALTALPL